MEKSQEVGGRFILLGDGMGSVKDTVVTKNSKEGLRIVVDCEEKQTEDTKFTLGVLSLLLHRGQGFWHRPCLSELYDALFVAPVVPSPALTRLTH